MTLGNLLAIRAFALISAALAADCLRLALTGGVPMPVQTHGTAIFEIPAEVWSGASLGQALALFASTFIKRAWFTATAAACGAIITIALAVFAAQAQFGFITSRIAFGVGCLHLLIVAAVIHDEVIDRLRAALHRIRPED